MAVIDITGIPKAKLLAGLFNNSKPLGRSVLQFEKDNMTEESAQQIIDKLEGEGRPLRFDYLQGRVMKVNLTSNELLTGEYDRDVGQGAAQSVVDKVLSGVSLENEVSQKDIDAAANLAMSAGINITTMFSDGSSKNAVLNQNQEIIDAVQSKVHKLKNQ